MPSSFDVSHLFRVDGLVALITGGGTGLGATMALALDANGAKAVYIVGRREAKLQEVAKAAKNGSVIPVVGDVSSQESLQAVAERVAAEHGYLNAVLANAGVGGFAELKLGPGMLVVPRSSLNLSAAELAKGFLAAGMQDFTNTQHVNTTGTFFTALAFLELLVKGNEKGNMAQQSQILVTTSAAAFTRTHAAMGYHTSKAATTSLCKSMATVFGPLGVRVNNLAPGFFGSGMSEPFAELVAPGKDVTEEGSVTKVCSASRSLYK